MEYIPLQTTKNSLLGEFAVKIVSVDDKIYIKNSGLGGDIMCFDIEGKFLFKPRIIFDTHGTLVTPEMWGHQLRSGDPDFTQDVRFLNVHCSGSKMFSLIDAITLKDHVQSETFADTKAKYPEKKEALIKLADSLKETDNPVLIVVTPKE